MAARHAFLDHDGLIAFAHRGGGSEWPENTMPAFEAAVNLGFAYLETDVHVTQDGVLLAFHDDVLDRVTDAKGRISDLDYDTVRQAKVSGRERIPRFEELLDAWPDIRINIDPKSDAAVAPLIECLKNFEALDRVCIGSFSGKRLAAVRQVFGSKVCTSMSPFDVIRLKAAGLGLPAGAFQALCAQVPVRRHGVTVVDRSLVEAAERLGLQIHVWTIDEHQDMENLIDLGVHGLMSGRPSLLKSVLQDRGLWR